MTVNVVWLFSPSRSGSSVTVYSAAAPWGHGVADEIFGPWDRSGEPYNYGPDQVVLKRNFYNNGERLTPPVVDLARRLFDRIGAATGTVICKHPHVMLDPDELREVFPDHRAVFLLRNPLARLNSVMTRKRQDPYEPNWNLTLYKIIARRWLRAEHRLLFEDLRADPRRYVRTLLGAWGIAHTEADLDAALAYQRTHYHTSSRRISDKGSPDRPESERVWKLPDEAIRAYLDDRFIRDLMERVGWSTNPDDYRDARRARPAAPGRAPRTSLAERLRLFARTRRPGVKVGWVLSLPGCGACVTARAAAAPWGHPIADGILSPERTRDRPDGPPERSRLAEWFAEDGCTLTGRSIDLASRIFTRLGRATGHVVCLHMHESLSPEQLSDAFPGHRAVYLIRNPVHRLNSTALQRSLEAIGPGYELDRFRFLVERWKAHPGRVLLDDLIRRPFVFFHTIFDAWGWPFDEGHVARAIAAARDRRDWWNLTESRDPRTLCPEGRFMLPRAAVDAYLGTEDITRFMSGLGWPTNPSAYDDGAAPDVIAGHQGRARTGAADR